MRFPLVVSLVIGVVLFSACHKENSEKLTAQEPGRKSPVDGIRISWDYSSGRRIASPIQGQGYCGYARMIQLHDERLACVYESAYGNIELVMSTDLGNTWDSPQVVFESKDNIGMAAPEIIELSNHDVLIACNARPRLPYTEDRKFGVKLRKSKDACQTWQKELLIYNAESTFENGCWEPAMLQLPDGEIQLFFANEAIYTHSSEQNISMFRSTDHGETWSSEPLIIGFRKNRRDGMPVPLYLHESNEILIAIEDNKTAEFKPAIYREKLSDNWSEGLISGEDLRRAYHPLRESLTNEIYAGAPYLARLSTGEVLLSYQSTWKRNLNWERANMLVEIGDKTGRNFSHRSVPFEIPLSKSALWNSLVVITDNTPVAITSTNAYASNSTEVWMKKGHVIPELTLPHNTPVVDADLEEQCWSGTWPYFVGSQSETYLRASICTDEDNLYVAVIVNDSNWTSDNENYESDGIIFQLDTERKGYEAPHTGIYEFHCGANDELRILQGYFGDWKEVSESSSIIKKSRIAENLYTLEMAIPLEFFDTKWGSVNKIGVNFILKNHSSQGIIYQDEISGNQFNQPFTWCPVRIK
ncbi:MAG: hypothetical protein COC06_00025 [Bacteroidales bacterium]|nr:MAG: hypothetical protein COC06_00025 [Bacteroidales bacterium]